MRGYRRILQKGGKNKIKILKMEEFYFRKHPLVEKSPPATDKYIYIYIYIF